ncbi:CYFA0S24e00364g1_1 [Cyberlindnera fabianii]|uniref:CYFA0S24e00364g1_1 n=1 Tax=Cyberlindnera fabianii TaxID=36022 RepID=A0A061BHY6_CYBFA|nr:CYFA0S24e00364g1_1 [Cyberlindnera fabianii]
MSLLPIIEAVDSFTYDGKPEEVYTLVAHDGKGQLGYILPSIAEQLTLFPDTLIVNKDAKTIQISASLDTPEKRETALNSVALTLREKDCFETLRGWRDEKYTVYYPESTPYVLLERAFCPLLGVVMYGVHVNGYIPPSMSISGGYEFWVPRRSATKATFPGMLDNTIAGGLGHPYGVYDTVIKESHEEAGIEKEYIEKNLKAVGSVSYMFCNDREGGIVQPEQEYVFDMVFDQHTKPFPVDHEAEDFTLMTLDEVLQRLHGGEFKPNCALVMVDFLIRHGLVTAENEPGYLEILRRSHRRFPFATK